MPFADVLQSARVEAVQSLSTRASLFNRLAKATENPSSRRRFYQMKSIAISRLIALGAAEVEELFPRQGMLTVALPNGRCLHCPVDQLRPDARRVLADRLTALCA